MFDSFLNRQPQGVILAGEKVVFQLDADADAAYLYCAYDGKTEAKIAMKPGKTGFSVSFAPNHAGLWWYRFAYEKAGVTAWIGAAAGSNGPGQVYRQAEQAQPFQLTVAAKKETVPSWYAKARIFHIFADRFANGNADGQVNAPHPNSFIYGQKGDTPYYIRQADGEIARWDFYGGNLKGILQHIPWLQAQGYNTIYLSPIFQARSNHRYDTGDYLKIEPMLGTLADFDALAAGLHQAGMHLMLDGVFNHVGRDSRYFNAESTYSEAGAANSQQSPYYDWFTFNQWPNQYASWWGVKDLPAINKHSASFHQFIAGSKGVLAYWTARGVDAWRLDVADELSNGFLKQIRQRLNQFPKRVVIGEVWEDASRKIAYGKRRQYLLGDQLQGVMNYPLREALLAFAKGQAAPFDLLHLLLSQKQNYPEAVFAANFNLLGSHDTRRLFTELDQDLASLALSVQLQFTLPGVPVVYYGDDAGLTGGSDPENRAFYPWGHENAEVQAIFHQAMHLRLQHPALAGNALFAPFTFGAGFGFFRQNAAETLVVLANPSQQAQASAQADLRYVPQDLQRHLPNLTVPPRQLVLQVLAVKKGA